MCNSILHTEVKWSPRMLKLPVMLTKRILTCFLRHVASSRDTLDGIAIYYDFSMNESTGKRYFVMTSAGCLGFAQNY